MHAATSLLAAATAAVVTGRPTTTVLGVPSYRRAFRRTTSDRNHARKLATGGHVGPADSSGQRARVYSASASERYPALRWRGSSRITRTTRAASGTALLLPHLLVRLLAARSRCCAGRVRCDAMYAAAPCRAVPCRVLSCPVVAVQRRRTPPLTMSNSGTGRNGSRRVSIRPPPWRRAAATGGSRR